jgi:hypothetical protein
MKKVTLENYRDDKYYPRIVRAVAALLAKGDVVAPIDVFVHMEMLARPDVEAWRFGRVPYLEKVIRCNRAQASRILRILRMHVHDLNMPPSPTAYVRSGKGPRPPLRFTKTGDPNLEEAYARHFLKPLPKGELKRRRWEKNARERGVTNPCESEPTSDGAASTPIRIESASGDREGGLTLNREARSAGTM